MNIKQNSTFQKLYGHPKLSKEREYDQEMPTGQPMALCRRDTGHW